MPQNDDISFDSVNDLADSLPYGPERTKLREKAIGLADMSGTERQQFEVRKDFVNDLCMDGSFTEKYFTVFPWLLNYAKKSGEDDDKTTVLWYYKWVISDMPEFPSVTKSQIERALEDLRVRYLEFGSNEKVYHDYAAEIYLMMGDYERCRFHQERWRKFKNRDHLDDCEACIRSRNVVREVKMGTLEKALKLAQPILKRRLQCTHVPKATWVHLLLPLLQHGREEEAAEFAAKIYKALSGSKFSGDSYYAYSLIIYYARQKDFGKAVKLFEKYFRLDLPHKNLYRRFFLYVAAQYLFTVYKKESIRLKLPPKTPFYRADSTYAVAVLREWFDKETDAIAALYDKRNENDVVSAEKRKLLAVQ